MDFSKALDHVPHHCHTHKAEYLGIQGPLLASLKSFLHQRSQRVLVDGEAPDTCKVISEVPQGIVLGPVLFLLFINVINKPYKLFANNLVIYENIKSQVDAATLHEDVNRLADWETTWV